MAVVEEDNTHLKEYVENLRSDIDSLLKLSARARDSGVWDPHDLSWCEVTFEQVFGGEEERPGPSPRQPVTVRKVSRGSHQSSELYDSRQVPCHHYSFKRRFVMISQSRRKPLLLPFPG